MDQETNVKDTGGLDQLEPGYVVNDRYEITGKLGSGGFAVVFLGRDLQIERDVAIKVMNTGETVSDPEVREQLLKRFRREASLAGRIDHSNVLNIYDYGVIDDEGDPFIVMERLEGHDLETQIRRQGAMDPAHVIPLFVDTLVALGVAHEHGIVHKDLKPSNLFLKRPGTRLESLCILDFGIAHIEREVRSRLTQAGQLMGTPAYLPPEYSTDQIVTPMLDIYQMGLILVEAMMGKPVVGHSEPMAAMFQHVREKLEVPQKLMESPLGPVLQRSMAADHEARFRDGLEFADALAAIPVEEIPAVDRDAQLVMLPQPGAGEAGTAGHNEDGEGAAGKTRQIYTVDDMEASAKPGGDEEGGKKAGQDSSSLLEETRRHTPAETERGELDGSGPQALPAVESPEKSTKENADTGYPAVRGEMASARVEQTASGGDVTPTPTTAAEDDGEALAEEFDYAVDGVGTSPGKVVAIVGVIAAMVALAIGGLWVMSVDDDEADDEADVAEVTDESEDSDSDGDVAASDDGDEDAEQTDDGDDEAPVTTIAVTSQPEGATLFRGDEELGVTPFELSFEGDEPIEAVLVLEDHEDKEVEITPEGAEEQSFELQSSPGAAEIAGHVGAPPTPGSGGQPGTPPAQERPSEAPSTSESGSQEATDEEPPDEVEDREETDPRQEDDDREGIEDEEPEDEGVEEVEEEPEVDEDDEDDDDGGGIRLPDY